MVEGSFDHLEEPIGPADGLRIEGGTAVVVLAIARLDRSSSVQFLVSQLLFTIIV
jgi:hypothetical protein